MADETSVTTVGVTAGSAFDLRIERDVFADMDVEVRPVDVETTEDLVSSLRDVDAVIDRLLAVPYTKAVIDELRHCKVIARCGIGVDELAHEYAAKKGVYVVNVPTYCQDEVSEHALMLVVSLQRNLVDYHTSMREGVWNPAAGGGGIHRLRGQTLGLVGFGTIARLVAEKARAFGLNVVVSDPYVSAAEIERAGATKRQFEDLLETADVVSLHTPLLEETEGMIDSDALNRMKESAYLINVSRGGLVVEGDLVDALREGGIRGAGLDVFRSEPAAQGAEVLTFDSPLTGLDNVVLTPHVAWYSEEANDERRRTAAMDVRRVLEGGEPANPVNEPQSRQ